MLHTAELSMTLQVLQGQTWHAELKWQGQVEGELKGRPYVVQGCAEDGEAGWHCWDRSCDSVPEDVEDGKISQGHPLGWDGACMQTVQLCQLALAREGS